MHRETISKARGGLKNERETISTQMHRSLSLYVARVPKTVRTKTKLYEIKLEKKKRKPRKKHISLNSYIFFNTYDDHDADDDDVGKM